MRVVMSAAVALAPLRANSKELDHLVFPFLEAVMGRTRCGFSVQSLSGAFRAKPNFDEAVCSGWRKAYEQPIAHQRSPEDHRPPALGDRDRVITRIATNLKVVVESPINRCVEFLRCSIVATIGW